MVIAFVLQYFSENTLGSNEYISAFAVNTLLKTQEALAYNTELDTKQSR